MRLQRLTGLEQEKIEKEFAELIKTIKELEKILADKKKQTKIIKDELLEIKDKFSDERRTLIQDQTGDISLEDMIAKEDMVVTISNTGYIKRNPIAIYRSQRRGGKGIVGMGTKEEDFVESLFVASTHDYLLFFTNKGRCYWLKVHEVPQAGRTARGKSIVNVLRLSQEEETTAILPIREF